MSIVDAHPQSILQSKEISQDATHKEDVEAASREVSMPASAFEEEVTPVTLKTWLVISVSLFSHSCSPRRDLAKLTTVHVFGVWPFVLPCGGRRYSRWPSRDKLGHSRKIYMVCFGMDLCRHLLLHGLV